ncbi:MAG: arylamine N-acetyltransferase [Denitrovibrio sp.]|nr:MAG: arylamine N-acetyltransferase [Denitrovibrio sp.]
MSDFDAYFKRLGIDPSKPSLELVNDLIREHIAQFSFNSISVLLKHHVSLEISDIYKKIVLEGRGGYCFEHNRLMHDVLASLGFKVRLLVAKVINNTDIDSPRTHRVTLLEWEGENYLVDVGFGPKGLRGAIKIENGFESAQNMASYRISINKYNDYQLEIATDDGYFSLYMFNFHRYTEADCIMGNFYSYMHPNAVFVNNLVLSRILPDMTLSLRNGVYHRIGNDKTDVIEITTQPQLKAIIEDDFGITLTDAECDILFEKV